MFFKKKCPRCGAKNSKERLTCMECGVSFENKQVKEDVSKEIVGNEEQRKEETVEPALPDLEEESLSSIAVVANVSPEKLRKLWVKANGQCQCLRITHGHGIPCGKKLRPDGSDWVCCDLYNFPGMPEHFGIFKIKEDAIICLECYNWKLDIDLDKLHSRPMA